MFAERFEIRGDAFDDPEIGRVADVPGGRPGFLEQLVHGLVVQRGERSWSSPAKKWASRSASK